MLHYILNKIIGLYIYIVYIIGYMSLEKIQINSAIMHKKGLKYITIGTTLSVLMHIGLVPGV